MILIGLTHGWPETGFLRKYFIVTRRFGEKPGFFNLCLSFVPIDSYKDLAFAKYHSLADFITALLTSFQVS